MCDCDINHVHSQIHDYPIDYNTYPLAKECIEYSYDLYSGDFIIIPKGWLHWVFTDKNTLAVSYSLEYFNGSPVHTMPYIGNIKSNITYSSFINNYLEHSFSCLYSKTSHCCPVYKGYSYTTFMHKSRLVDIINIAKYNRLYAYVGMESTKNTILDKNHYVWFTLDNNVDSGLHYDNTNNFLHVIDGKKTIKLYSPECKEKMYIKDFKYIKDVMDITIISE
jgi:hypothetical protein